VGKTREWTPQQEYGFSVHGGSLLVSAAAGSGKTAVLVERIIRRITDPENHVDVDRLLIVTFTRAAAAEMRQRLSDALSDKMAAEPNNMLYARQQMLLPQANISTIDGFCVRLLQEFAGRTGLPVGFRVAEEGQTKLLISQALDTVLEQNYRRQDPAFMQLASQLSDGKDDFILRRAVLTANEFMQAQPFPQRWLQQQMDAYTAVMPLEKTDWMKPIIKQLDFMLERIGHYTQQAIQVATRTNLDSYMQTLPLDADNIRQLRQRLPEMTYDEIRQQVVGYKPLKLISQKKPDAVQAEGKEAVASLRKRITDRLKQAAGLLPDTEQQCREDMAKMAPMVEALCRLVQEFTACYTDLKRQQKTLDFSDLTHEALKLLVDPDTDKPTLLARQLSSRFEEIMVDEYQDCNAAQNTLFRALSREESNLFMVGDIKQSIYGFRQAMPEIFSNRLKDYPPYVAGGTLPATITLGNNFRSRRDVTDSVNFLFGQLMRPSLGDVAYGEQERLEFSATYYPPSDRCHTEWMLLNKEDAEDITEVEMEARHIAVRIHQLMQEMTVTDGDVQRPLQYSDVCILMQKRRDMPTFVKEFARLGIPLSADKSENFLTTPEVSTAIALLRVVDNPLREVALSAVLLSPLYGFTPDDLARIRLAGGKYAPLYTAVEAVVASDSHPELARRLSAFLGQIRRFRTLAATLPAADLLETIYRETAIEAVYAARLGGRQRVANLHQLDKVARGYEQGEYRGLSAFVRHLDHIEESGGDIAGGTTLQQDGVRMMTIHGSKGLEFPVVFVARLCNQYGNNDSKAKLLFHADAGIGMKLVDRELNESHTPLPFKGVLAARQLDEMAEDLRVMYVALTRAREKLILVYSMRKPHNLLSRAEEDLPDGIGLLTDSIVTAVCPGQYLLTAALRHEDFTPLRPPIHGDSLPCKVAWTVSYPTPPDVSGMAVAQRTHQPADDALVDTLTQRLRYHYPHAALFGIPAKLTASQLSHQQMQRANVTAARPAFLQEEGMTAAQKGTATHTFMQYADYAAAHADLEGEIARLVAAGFLTEQQADALNVERLTAFFAGDLYRRMAGARQVWREYSFAVNVDAGSIADLPEAVAGEPVLIQGIADCVFAEEDGLVLVDYKTDRVKTPEQLADRYRSQLVFYKQALEQLLELPVKEMLLYSFALGEVVEVTE